MTPSFDTSRPGSSAGLFRPADHVLAVPQGSAMAILDLERGVVYATTSVGAESWNMLVAGTRPANGRVAERPSGPDDDEDAHAWARMAGYLLDRRIIELATR